MQDLGSEVAAAGLGDKRLARRFGLLVDQLAEQPDASLPDALSSGELEAAYRFVNNKRVTLPGLLEPHITQTQTRCAEQPSVIVAHDTSECSFRGERKNVGRLRSRGRGYYLHASLAISDAVKRDPLGIIALRTLSRGAPRPKERGSQRRKDPDRESRRWGEQILDVEQRLGKGRAIHVADREADAYELFAELQSHNARFVIRVYHDRRVETPEGPTKLEAALESSRTVVEREVAVTARRAHPVPATRKTHPPREARTAKLSVSAIAVTFRQPREAPAAWPTTLTVNVVHVRELEPPLGCEPVEWKLITSEAVDTVEQVLSVVDAYRARWMIEEYFKALKTGCSLEKRQNESLHALLNVLGLYVPIAWQLLRLRSLARNAAGTPATEVLTDRQVQILKGHPRTRGKTGSSPSVRDVLLAIATLGGHLKNNGEPGWITLSRGFQKLLALEAGWQLGMVNADQRCDR